MKLVKWIWLAVPAVVMTAFKPIEGDKSAGEPKHRLFFDKSGMDTTVNPGDNFFLYANGNWLKKTAIPASEKGWGTFYELANDNVKNLHQILIDVSARNNAPGSKEQKVADLYKSGMDTAAIEQLGFDPVKPILAKINAVKNYRELVNLVADSYQQGEGDLLGLSVSPDDRISNKNIAHFDQTGINLPNREYYFKTDSASQKIRAEYLKYIAQLFALTGVDAATADQKQQMC